MILEKSVNCLRHTVWGNRNDLRGEIANVLRHEGLDVKVVNAKRDKVKDINECELVIVGSGIQINRWTKEPKKFLKKFKKELTKKSCPVCLLRQHKTLR